MIHFVEELLWFNSNLLILELKVVKSSLISACCCWISWNAFLIISLSTNCYCTLCLVSSAMVTTRTSRSPNCYGPYYNSQTHSLLTTQKPSNYLWIQYSLYSLSLEGTLFGNPKVSFSISLAISYFRTCDC